ncbi:rod shape-determining protein MreC [Macrococcus hajekii]|uniref:Cell shape-determining protein MreC n=1 Tax=Macrococcus hajekii TaxID=198482 RepID=A0A4R6BMC1_9STAP|nr:rod shape-determining protein MreC [Macrococcus hajekii]TDM02807.1 rod shape-determining protein MreC [Macrococcus hajekii]GGB04062.1 cell shape-determining protein MreC [Macrococcus hajekii]
MPDFYKRNKLVFILFGIILFIMLVGLSLKERTTSVPEQIIGDSTAAGQRIVSYPMMFIGQNLSNLVHMWDAAEENKDLRAKIRGFNQMEADNYRLEKENAELRELMKTESIASYDPEIATIIARNQDDWMNTFTINKGHKSGVKDNMAVITNEGLVGRIKKANAYSSQVELISSSAKASKISVTLQNQGSEVFGMIDQYDDSKNLLIIDNIENNIKLKVGTNVVTSGLGGQFPKGIVIGKVKKVENDEFGLSQIAYVETEASLKDLTHVYVAMKSKAAGGW